MKNSFIWPIDRTIPSATILVQCWPGSNGNEVVLRIPQISSITGDSPSNGLILYRGHFYPQVDAVSVFYNPADWDSFFYLLVC